MSTPPKIFQRREIRQLNTRLCSGDCGRFISNVSTARERVVRCEECDRWFCGSCATEAMQTCFCLPKRVFVSGDGMVLIEFDEKNSEEKDDRDGNDGEGALLCCKCVKDMILSPLHCCASCRRIACGTCCSTCAEEVASELRCEDCDAVSCGACSERGVYHACGT